ncbi:MAG: hypothetical protein ACRDKT_14745 [Actinomycetota bacterium]
MSAVAAPAAPRPAQPRGRLSPLKIVFFVAVALAAILIVAYLAIATNAPAEPEGQCDSFSDCRPLTAPALVTGRLVTGELGYEFSFDDDQWAAITEEGDFTELQEASGAPLWLQIEAVPASEADPAGLVQAKLDALGSVVSQLGEVTGPEFVITSPGVGYHRGEGGLFAGTLEAQGQSVPVAVAVMSASDGEITAIATMIAGQDIYEPAASITDGVLNTFLYPSERDA